MIIRVPTGLYDTILPKKEEDNTSVTFTISTDEPPRSEEVFQELPIAEAIRPRVPPDIDDQLRRETVGELIFTVTEASQTISGSAKKTFEVGEILSFEEEVSPTSVTQTPRMVEIRHDTNLLDLEAVGLSTAEILILTELSEQRKSELEIELLDLTSQIEDTKVRIRENQKNINETEKTISAVKVIADGSEPTEILEKLEARLVDLKSERSTLTSQLSALDVAAVKKRDELLQVSQLVR
jgi:hypothetical protein